MDMKIIVSSRLNALIFSTSQLLLLTLGVYETLKRTARIASINHLLKNPKQTNKTH